MKVDWLHPTLYEDFASMANSHVVVSTNPSTGQSIGYDAWRGGQHLPTVPPSLGSVTGAAAICVDVETGEEYVRVSGQMVTKPRAPDLPETFVDRDYWSYGWTGWPIIAAIPNDRFGAQDLGAEHEFGGRVITPVGGYDPDGEIDALNGVGEELPLIPVYSLGSPGYPPYTIDELGGWREGSSVVGGVGGSGWFPERGPEPPIGQLTAAHGGWMVKAISQRCWVLLVASPAAHPKYDPEAPGYYRDHNYGGPPEQPAEWDGLPMVISPQSAPPLLAPFMWFLLMWRRGGGSGQSGTFDPGGGGGGTPSTVIVG
jgi:hypothetical protein